MNLRPTSDNVIVKVSEEKEEVSATGILISTSGDKNESGRGEVLAVGPGRVLDNGQRSTFDVKVGDVILFKKYQSEEMSFGGVKFAVVKNDGITAVIE
ncbi:co-chaperone GroES [bacterium]|nr:co-chaperone GroES [bacterium]